MPNKKNILNNENGESHLTGFTDANVHIMPQMFYEKAPEKKKGGKMWTIILISLVVLVLTAIIILVFFLMTQNTGQANNQTGANQNSNTPKVAVEQTAPKTNTPVADLKTTSTTTNNPATTNNTVNTNTSANTITNTTEKNPENTSPILSETKITLNKELTKGLDTDKDNLSDTEEGIFAASITKPDTDSDGFMDGEEVKNLYDPTIAGGLLESSDQIAKYENQSFKYSILYPKEWAAKALDQTNREVIFSSTTGDFIEVLAEDNPNLESAKTWYLKQFPEVSASQLTTVVTRDGMEGVLSIDSMTAYFSNGYLIFAIAYNIGNKTVLDYRTTFDMMIKSFKLI